METVLILAAAFGAGVLNTIAGGGTFLTFPALVFIGLPPVMANATSAVAVFPGYLGGALGFRSEIGRFDKKQLLRLIAVTLIGGLIGSLLLLVTSNKAFSVIVPFLLLAATLAFLFLLGVFMGPQGVAFQLLLAKVIPISRRGQLQAWRNVVGGVVAAVLAWAAGRYIVEANLFGNGYATTFVIAVVLTSLGLTALRVLIREPELPTARPKSRVIDRVREFPTLLAADRGFAHFLLATALANGARIAAPFYILFAGQSVELNGSTLGYLSLAYLGADTLSNLAWGAAGDRVGFRSSFIVSLALWAASIVLLINAHDLTLLLGAFIGLGASQSGYLMSSQTMVLEFGSRDDMAMRLAILSTVQGALSAIGPLVGGLLAASVGYASLFWAAVVLLAAGLLVLVFLVDEPRRRRATEGR